MKYIIYFFTILLFWSCDTRKLEEIRALPENELEAPVLQSMETIVIDQDSYDEEELVTFIWEPAYFGFDAAANYSIYVSSNTFSDYVLASNIKSTSFTIDHQALYGKLVDENGLALPVDEITTVNVYVTATIGSEFAVVKSASKEVTFNISKIGMEGDLLYIAGEFNNWSSTRAAIVGLNKVYAGYVDMNWRDHDNVLYKFVDKVYTSNPFGDWYGGALNNLSTTGDNMSTTPGMKYFDVDLNTRLASIVSFTKVGLTGVNGVWGTPTEEMIYDHTNKQYSVVLTVDTRSFRVLCAPGWSYTMGPKTLDELVLSVGSDVKIYDSRISAPLVGKDPNMALTAAGTYKFTLYYSTTDAAWHFKVENP